MIDQNRLVSKPLGYSLVGLSLFFGIAELMLFLFSGGLPPHYDVIATSFVFTSAFVIVPALTLAAMKYEAFKLPAIVAFHLLMGVLLVWFSEILTPFTAVWSIMILFASTYYGWKGFTASGAFLGLLAVLYCSLFYNDLGDSPTVYIILSGMVVALTIFMSFLFVRVIVNGQKKNVELSQAQKSEQIQTNRQTTLLNSISDAVLTLNRYGRVTSQNAAAQVFFDTNESLIGRDIASLLEPYDGENKSVEVHDLLRSVKSSTIRDDLSIGKGGDMRHLSLQISRIRSTFDDDEEYGVVLIIRDITKQKSLEEEKDEFISVTSHELRTPIAIAEGSLSNLLMLYGKKDTDGKVLHSAAQTAYDQIIYLSKIINDLSTLSRAERGLGDSVEEIDVNELLHELYMRYEPEAKAKSLHLNLDVEAALPHIETSRLYLEEILQNFITNAIKYTKQGSVTISAKLLSNGRIECSVIDTGIGIGKADLKHIFEKFYRSEDYRTRETSGTGLGLYVVRKLADKLETKIEVESRLEHGSTFRFVLPLKSRNLETAKESPAKIKQGSSAGKKSTQAATTPTPVVQ